MGAPGLPSEAVSPLNAPGRAELRRPERLSRSRVPEVLRSTSIARSVRAPTLGAASLEV
jgi:hypothetical protein